MEREGSFTQIRHQLRNYLTASKAAIDLLLTNQITCPEEKIKLLKIIKINIEGIIALTDHLKEVDNDKEI